MLLLRRGSNGRLVRELCLPSKKQGIKVRVGGGIRTVARAATDRRVGRGQGNRWQRRVSRGKLNHGFLRRLLGRIGRRRTVLALDAEAGNIVVRGWREKLQVRPRTCWASARATPRASYAPTWTTRARCAGQISIGTVSCGATRICLSPRQVEFEAMRKFGRSNTWAWMRRWGWRCTPASCGEAANRIGFVARKRDS